MNAALRFLAEEVDEFATQEVHHDDQPWGSVIGACLLTQLITLSGVFLSAIMSIYNKSRGGKKKDKISFIVHNVIVPSFAAGALLATAVFLLVPESLILIGGGGHEEEAHEEEHRSMKMMRHHRFLEGEDEHEGHNEGATSWKFGAALLAGFLFPAILHAIFPTVHADHGEELDAAAANHIASQTANQEALPSDEEDKDCVASPQQGQDVVDQQGQDAVKDEPSAVLKSLASDCTTNTVTASDGSLTQEKNWGLATSILVGDAFHNFTDGVFIGAAFLLCGSDFGWTLVATTIYHELAQEIADFALLTHHCGFTTVQALALNFCAGFSIFLGGIVILSTDVNDLAQGIILAISAGVYFYIGGTECVPRAQKAAESAKQTLLFLGCFVIGVVPIGLVLLNHDHCEGQGGDEHDEDVHGHVHL